MQDKILYFLPGGLVSASIAERFGGTALWVLSLSIIFISVSIIFVWTRVNTLTKETSKLSGETEKLTTRINTLENVMMPSESRE